MGGSIRSGTDIHGPRGSATRAKERADITIVNHLTNERLTKEQKILALREASKHPKARLHFKSAGLIDSDELETLRHMISQSNNRACRQVYHLIREPLRHHLAEDSGHRCSFVDYRSSYWNLECRTSVVVQLEVSN